MERYVHGCLAVVPMLCLSLGISAVRADWPDADQTPIAARLQHDVLTSPDGRYAALSGPAGIELRELEPQRLILRESIALEHLTLSDHLLVGAGVDGRVYRWELERGARLPPLPTRSLGVTRVATDPQGRIAASDVDGGIHVWGRDGDLLLQFQLGRAVTDLELFEGLVYVRGEGRCRILDLGSGAPVDALDGSVGRSPASGFYCAPALAADGVELG